MVFGLMDNQFIIEKATNAFLAKVCKCINLGDRMIQNDSKLTLKKKLKKKKRQFGINFR